MQYALDLNKSHDQRTYGDITVFMTWVRDGNAYSPCLALVPTFKIGHPGVYPCVVHLRSAWKWDERVGDGRFCAMMSTFFAKILGLPFSMDSSIRILSIVRDCLDDLILKIPPRPTERVVVADAFRTDEDGKTTHSEIAEHV